MFQTTDQSAKAAKKAVPFGQDSDLLLNDVSELESLGSDSGEIKNEERPKSASYKKHISQGEGSILSARGLARLGVTDA